MLVALEAKILIDANLPWKARYKVRPERGLPFFLMVQRSN